MTNALKPFNNPEIMESLQLMKEFWEKELFPDMDAVINAHPPLEFFEMVLAG